MGSRTTKWIAIAFPAEVRENTAIKVQLADLFIDSLESEIIRPDVIKESPTRLSVAIGLTKDEKRWSSG